MTEECKVTKKPQPHAELIKAWADGAEIQVRPSSSGQWADCENPYWEQNYEYRIKPEPKPDLVYYGVFEMNGKMVIGSFFTKLYEKGDELKLTFDGETGQLKSAEVLT